MSGYNWTEQTGSAMGGWTSIASSFDGSRLVACMGGPGYIYTSDDSGITWTQRHILLFWSDVASSLDGMRLVAVTGGDTNEYVYTSNDAGITWGPRIALDQHRGAVACSSNGEEIFVSEGALFLYISQDYGATWGQSVWGYAFWDVACSADGVKLVACQNGSAIYTSVDKGFNWTITSAGNRKWTSVASSFDGTKLVGVVDNGYIYTSDDSGITWTERISAGSRRWMSVASSTNGAILAATAWGDYIYVSDDSGVTWIEQTEAGIKNWGAITTSSDGSKLAACVWGVHIWTNIGIEEGGLIVDILPADVLPLDAQWQATPDPAWYNSGVTVGGLSVGNHTISFKDVTGWTKPINIVTTIVDGVTNTVTGTYTQIIIPTVEQNRRVIVKNIVTNFGCLYHRFRFSISTRQTINRFRLLGYGMEYSINKEDREDNRYEY